MTTDRERSVLADVMVRFLNEPSEEFLGHGYVNVGSDRFTLDATVEINDEERAVLERFWRSPQGNRP